MTPSLPAPDDVTDGVASWDADPAEITTARREFVTMDGRALAPASARAIGRALLAAADYSEGVTA
jgi:hypothetical protein